MKEFAKLFFTLIFLIIFSGCEEDEDSPGDDISFPISIIYSGIENPEFRMFTNQTEVSTSGLDIRDYMDAEDWNVLSPEYYDSLGIVLTFDEDSIYGFNAVGEEENYSYEFRDDSLFFRS